MDSSTASYRGHRFPAEIISRAVWLYHRFCLSFRDVEDLLAERGVTVSYETIRHWCGKFGTKYARTLKRRERRLGDTWHLDELFVTIQGQRQYLWRAVDQDKARLLAMLHSWQEELGAKRPQPNPDFSSQQGTDSVGLPLGEDLPRVGPVKPPVSRLRIIGARRRRWTVVVTAAGPPAGSRPGTRVFTQRPAGP
jgi:hypothetical protein